MSAIFGIIDFAGRPLEDEWVESMQKDLAHRGPDGRGLYREPSVAMGHLLLQVTPESVYDKSPYEEDGFVITAYARLDEREAIMDRLNTPLEERDKITDPLLLLRSFRKFGKDFVKDIYGDFAFAIWDKQRKELFCARDQMGVKPFLYYYQDNRFVFSTEIKSIARLQFVKTIIDIEHIKNVNDYIIDENIQTTWVKICRLAPASILSLSISKNSISAYWKPSYKRNPELVNLEQAAKKLRNLLEKVISDHTRTIGQFGSYLSGGLDSSTITVLSARKALLKGERLITASSILDPNLKKDKNDDEMDFINEIIKQEKNIEPLFICNNQLELLTEINQKFERHYDLINYFHYVDEALYKQFRNKSVRRVLSGSQGDSTVSNRYISPFPHLIKSGRILKFFRLFSSTRNKMRIGYTLMLKSLILLHLSPIIVIKYWSKMRRKSLPWEINLDSFFLRNPEEQEMATKLSKEYFKDIFVKNRSLETNIWDSTAEAFAEEMDCGSSYNQIEMTYPFADRRIVEYLLQVPVEHFYAEGFQRGLIRKAMSGYLPEKIRLKNEKGAYSPDFHQVLLNDLSKVDTLLFNEEFKHKFGNVLDIKKIEFSIKIMKSQNNNVTFDQNYWNFHRVVILVFFLEWYRTKK